MLKWNLLPETEKTNSAEGAFIVVWHLNMDPFGIFGDLKSCDG